MSKQKVLFIGNFLSKTKGTISPSESIVNYLQKQGFNVTKTSTIVNPIFRLLAIITKLIFSNAKTIHIDVFSGKAFEITRICAMLSKLRNKQLILTLHGGGLPQYTLKHKEKVIQTLKKADYIQSPSKGLIAFFANYNLTTHYLPNPIEIDNFPFKQHQSNKINLLWVRAFHEIYNPIFVIDVLNELKIIFPSISLTMIGPDKGLLQAVKAKVKELNLEGQVNIIGPIPNNQLKQYYHAHMVFLNTPNMESFGVAVAEAALCGTPIVSFNIDEIPLLWQNNHDMILVEKLNIQETVSAIKQLVNSEQLRNKLANNALKKAKLFESKKIFESWESLLFDIERPI